MPMTFFDRCGERYALYKNMTIGTLLYSTTKHCTYSGIAFEQLSARLQGSTSLSFSHKSQNLATKTTWKKALKIWRLLHRQR